MSHKISSQCRSNTNSIHNEYYNIIEEKSQQKDISISTNTNTSTVSNSSNNNIIFNQYNCDQNNNIGMTCEIGTIPYMAPEIIQNIIITKFFTYVKNKHIVYTKSVDVYSYGIVLWELLENKVIYNNLNLLDIRETVLNGIRPKITKFDSSQNYIQLIKQCWASSPILRPNFIDIIPVLQKIIIEYKKRN